MDGSGISRRRFIHMMAALPAGSLAAGLSGHFLTDFPHQSLTPGPNGQELAYMRLLSKAEKAPAAAQTLPKIVKAKGKGLFNEDLYPEADKVVALVYRAVCALTGARTAAEAFRTVAGPRDRVAVRMSTYFNRGVVDAVVKGLLAAGVPPGNITLYRSHVKAWVVQDERYDTGAGSVGVQQGVYGFIQEFVGTMRLRLARVIYECTALINVANLNSHVMTELTGALKNHVGSVDKPKLLHDSIEFNLSLLNNLPVIRDKTRLVVVDAMRPSLKGHPGFTPEKHYLESGTIIAGYDPVAADAVGLELLKEGRRARGIPDGMPIADRMLALASKLGVGQSDLKKIRQVEIAVE